MEAYCRIEMFGELRVLCGDQIATRFRTQKAAALLAYLALRLPQAQTRERLIDVFWPEMEMAAARDNLSTALSQLRRQLEPTGTPSGTILKADHQYVRLNPEAVRTDVGEFDSLMGRAAGEDDPAEKTRLLQQVAGVYRGELLPGRFEDWAVQEQTRCQQAFMDCLRQLVRLLEEAGSYEPALAMTQRAIQTDLYEEEFYRWQMRLQVRLKRPAAALQTFETLKHLFQQDLGVQPSAVTRQLADMVRQDPRAVVQIRAAEATAEAKRVLVPVPAAPPERAASSPSAAATALPPGLPLQLTRFFGRENDLAQLTQHVTDPETRLVTLLGPGGVGKTRLSIEAARSASEAFGNRVWFVALADLPDASLIPAALVNTLRLPPSGQGDPLDRVADALGEQPCLMVLDNFEHLLREAPFPTKSDNPVASSSAALVRLLLQRVPNLTCIVTSRQPLRLGGEIEFALSPLSTSVEAGASAESLLLNGSVALFTDRARTARPDFALTANNAQTIATLCKKLEGMPLAIEMAAAWTKTLSPVKILERLERQLDMLVSRRRDLPVRHQSLRATIEWSYDLLEPDLRRFLASLSVFRGGWHLEAAETICGEEALHALSALQEQSLIVVLERDDETRYRLLEPLREFGQEKLVEDGRLSELGKAHAVFFYEFAQEASAHFHSAEEKEWLDRIAADEDNIRGAIQWMLHHDIVPGLQLVAKMSWYWQARGGRDEGVRWCVAYLESPEAVAHPDLRVPVLNVVGTLAYLKADYPDSVRFFEKARALAEERQLPGLLANALHGLGNVAYSEKQYDEARDYYTRGLTLRTELGEMRGLAASCHSLGNLEMRLGDYPRAREFFEQALEIREKRGDKLGYAYTAGALGQLARYENDLPLSFRYARSVMLTFLEMGVIWPMNLCLNDLAQISLAMKRYEPSVTLLAALIRIREETNHPIPPAERADHEELIAELRGLMGDSEFERAWGNGLALTLEQAIQYGLSLDLQEA